MKWLRRLAWLLVLGGIAAAVAWSLRPQPIPVEVATAEVGGLRVTIDEEGATRVRDRYVVSAPLAGRLRRINLRPGDPVVAGETLLCRIDPLETPLLDPRTRAEAAARVAAAEATRQHAGAQLEKAKASLALARSELKTAEELHARGEVTGEELKQRQLDVRLKEEDQKAATFSLQVAAHELTMAEAALNRGAPGASYEKRTEQVGIRSPISGVVLTVPEESERVVTPGTPIMGLGDLSSLEVVVDLLTTDAVKVSPGDLARLHGWGGDEELAGEVRRIEPSAFTRVSALGIEEQRVNVIIDRVGHWAQLGNGYRVEASIIIWEAENILTIPQSALFRSEDRWAVYVVEGGVAGRRFVEPGRRSGLDVQITEGLAAGEVVIRFPGDRVTEGTAVVGQ